MKPIENYLRNSHHMAEEEVVQTLQELADFSAKHYIDPMTRDSINLQLNADNVNADFFYSTDTEQAVHHFVEIIHKNLTKQN